MSRFANLGERLSADLPTDQPQPEQEDDETTTSKPKDKEKDMSEEIEKAKAEGHSEGFKAANDRMNAVFASEHYEGRETQAKAMLAKDMSAADIIDILAATPKVEPVAETVPSQEAAEEAACKEMKNAIDKNANSAVEPSGADNPDKKKTASAVWDRANAKIEQRRKGN